MILSTVIFIAVAVIFVRNKTRIQRELEQARNNKKYLRETTTYEEIELHQPLPPTVIDTRKNIVYGHIS